VSTDLIIILITIIACFAIGLVFIKKWLTPKTDSSLSSWLQSIQSSLESTNSNVSRQLFENSRHLSERLDNATRVIGDVQRNLGGMSEVGKGIRSLQEFLQSPKLRGGLGEEILADMIGQTFPKNAFHLQYSFKSGVKVDAVLKTDAGLLCIDSKFPLENFNALLNGETENDRVRAKKEFISDVKKHIEAISKKYILPEENTMDFALMYIPSESVYYEIINIPEISNYARSCRVYPVSPNTLYAHLQVLLTSFQGKELESKSKEVFRLLRAIQKDYSKVEENLGVLNRHITNTYNQFSNVSSMFTSLGQKITQTHSLQSPSDENLKSTLE